MGYYLTFHSSAKRRISMHSTPSHRLVIQFFAILLLSSSLGACSNFSFPGVYRIQVPQGNVFDEDMIEQLEIGMTRSQVRFVMGTALIKDSFNQDRWDYTYQVQKGEELSQKKRMTLHFEGDKLARIEGDASVAGSPNSNEDNNKNEAG